jgi:two-component system, chemotaxis family, chemotaxis protein CheY
MPTHVLVIDDDSATRKMVRFILEDAEYVVLEAADTTTALDLLHTSPVGVVVLFDYRMPRSGGAELLALAEREHGLADRHTFVCMTASAHDLPPTLSALLSRYDVPLVAKPFHIDELLAAIAQAEHRLTSERQTCASCQ